MTRLAIVFSVMALLACLTSAKRTAPPKVEPVIHDGILYVAPNDDGRRAYIQVWDIQTNKKFSELTVFTNHIDPKLEQDVQWVFINKLNVLDDTLLVTSERGKTYRIDLSTKAITQSDLEQSPAPDAAAQRSDIPEAVKPSRMGRSRRITSSPFI